MWITNCKIGSSSISHCLIVRSISVKVFLARAYKNVHMWFVMLSIELDLKPLFFFFFWLYLCFNVVTLNSLCSLLLSNDKEVYLCRCWLFPAFLGKLGLDGVDFLGRELVGWTCHLTSLCIPYLTCVQDPFVVRAAYAWYVPTVNKSF